VVMRGGVCMAKTSCSVIPNVSRPQQVSALQIGAADTIHADRLTLIPDV